MAHRERRRGGRVRCSIAILATAVLLASAPPAPGGTSFVRESLAALEALAGRCVLRDATDGDVSNGVELGYRLCDDGNSSPGRNGIPVPIAYHPDASGNDWTGLPAPASAGEIAAADARDDLRPEPPGDRATLDVDITLPPESMTPPPGGFPILLYIHGGAGDRHEFEATTVDATAVPAPELAHRSNVWYATRGYVVMTFGQRFGFPHGSPATLQVSRRYDVNDGQYLVGLLADHDADRAARGEPSVFRVNADLVAATGFSSGSMMTWMLTTDPTWSSPVFGRPLRLAASVPYAGFTDLPEILAPSGHFFDRDPRTGRPFVAPVSAGLALSRRPVGVLKQSFIISVLCGADPGLVFNRGFHLGCKRLTLGEPYDPDADPILRDWFDRTLNDMSPYYQPEFFARVEAGLRIPIFAVQGWGDAVTPPIEAIRFYNKLRSIDPTYPIAMYLGDVGHFMNKLKEWGDLCGADRHVCTLDDYRRAHGSLDFDDVPDRVRSGVGTRMSDFLDHHLRGRGPAPAVDVTATTKVCAATATPDRPGDAPGPEYRAPSLRALADVRRIPLRGSGTTSSAAPDPRGIESDPSVIDVLLSRGLVPDDCYTTSRLDPGPGVVRLRSRPLASGLTMLGLPTVRLRHHTRATDYYVAARLFDLAPGGVMTLVSRGVCRVNTVVAPDARCRAFDLFGGGWIFDAGHRMVLEITQSDATFLRRDNLPSAIEVQGAALDVPVAA